MILRSITYESSSQVPSFELGGLKTYNELSGGPASGKTLILDVIVRLAETLSPSSSSYGASSSRLFPSPGLVVASFAGDGGDHLEYRIGRTAREIICERVTVNGNVLLNYESGRSRTFFAQLDQFITGVDASKAFPSHRVSRNNQALASRVDHVQHPYLIPLINWAHSVYHFNAEETAHDRNVRIDSNLTAESADELSITTGPQVRTRYLSGTERRMAQLSSVVRMLKGGGVILIDDYREDLWSGFPLPMTQVIAAHSASRVAHSPHITHNLSRDDRRVISCLTADDAAPWSATLPPPRSA